MFVLNGMAGHLTELTGMQLRGGVTNTSENYYGTVVCSGSSNNTWRVDNCLFNNLYGKNIVVYGNAMSVIDHNTFLERAIAITANNYFQGDSDGDLSYASPPTFGVNSSNVLYVEDNYFTNIISSQPQVCDGQDGGRIVFRHNVVLNDNWGNHGTETGGRTRSERSFEVYDNSFSYPTQSWGNACFTANFIRGGSGVIYSNTFNGYNAAVTFRDFRLTDSFCGQWYPFCGANGTNSWDSNNPTIYFSGTHTGDNNSPVLVMTNANWTPNQWYGYTVMNLNSGLFSVVLTNSANTIYYIGSDSHTAGIVHNTLLTFNNGDHFRICLVNVSLDQPGRGSGDLLRDNGQDANGNLVVINTATGTSAWPHQALEPLYCWGNRLNGSPVTSLDNPYPQLKDGRDYYSNTPKPGYTPFVYPHPLVSGTINTNGGGTTNTSQQLLPPVNVHISGHSP